MRKLLLAALLLSASLCLAQNDAASFAAELFRYQVHPNIVYHVANNYEAKLDVYEPATRLSQRRWLSSSTAADGSRGPRKTAFWK